jgi:ABC-type transport system involved in cytochrome bd biosynthesis fused ATPase/permease subunit
MPQPTRVAIIGVSGFGKTRCKDLVREAEAAPTLRSPRRSSIRM